ncbi:MAG TPA: hypothetical protein EYO73_07525 [Sulfurimonas sp.]|nr:hypothetical protein [Sulfurimonas sp.]
MLSLNPTQGEIEEARLYPNGWIYRIDENFDKNENIPPHAIMGAWKVDNEGNLTDEWKIYTI